MVRLPQFFFHLFFFLDHRIVSYGPCQFPTLGFVVERFKQHINFIREPFWKLLLTHTKDKVKVRFGLLEEKKCLYFRQIFKSANTSY